VLADELEEARVTREGNAAEEGEEQSRESRRGRAGELGGGEEEAVAWVGQEQGEGEREEGGGEGGVECGEAGAGCVEDDEEAARKRGRVGEEGEG
jgi:hypothetical protein